MMQMRGDGELVVTSRLVVGNYVTLAVWCSVLCLLGVSRLKGVRLILRLILRLVFMTFLTCLYGYVYGVYRIVTVVGMEIDDG